MAKQILICLGYLMTFIIYLKYEKNIKKAIYKILPFLIFYWLVGTLFKVIIKFSFR